LFVKNSEVPSSAFESQIHAPLEESFSSNGKVLDALLIYPNLGGYDSFIVDLPLSIVYAGAGAVKAGYNVKMVDLRVEDRDWQDVVKDYLDEGVQMVGISVMTGTPLKNAREISNFVRQHSPNTKILWGGPHCTVVPETISEPYVDFLIRGYGSEPLRDLIEIMRSGNEDPSEYSKVSGISYKVNGKIHHVPRPDSFEQLNHWDLPYHLVNVSSPRYVRAYNGNRMFYIFSSIGCPYKCTFCVSPATFKEINGKHWLPIENDEVLEHMEYIQKEFGVKHICFIDDTSFPKIDRMRSLFEAIIHRGMKVSLEFRGARVNEINKMDDDFLDLMVRAGGKFLQCGVESGSDRILKKVKNGQSRAMIEDVNRKLARHQELIVHYNFIYGTPRERLEDLEESKELQLTLVRDNPSARIGFGGDWKPIPGTQMLEDAEKEFGYKPPVTVDDWIQMDSVDADEQISHSWYTPRHEKLIRVLQMASFVIDDKMIKESRDVNSSGIKVIRFLARLYKPIALFRLKAKFYDFLIDFWIYNFISRKVVPLLNFDDPKRKTTQDIRGF
jgi:radical SAM superfamily enzyme YgiQ (UPF0313 family)